MQFQIIGTVLILATVAADAPQLTKITTATGEHIGESQDPDADPVVLLEITSGKALTILATEVTKTQPISEADAIQAVGLPSVLAWRISRGLPQKAADGQIIHVKGTTYYTDLGSAAGVVRGELLQAYEAGEELKDPSTGATIGRDDKIVATLIVREVEEKFCKASITSGTKSPKVGNRVRPLATGNTLAILPITDQSGMRISVSPTLTEQLRTALAKRNVQAVEGSRIEKALAGLNAGNATLFSRDIVRAVGAETGANAVVSGVFTAASNTIDITLEQADTGRVYLTQQYAILDGKLAKELADVSPIGKQDPNRARWFCATYGGTIYQVSGTKWQEIGRDGKTRDFIETQRTDEYIELDGLVFGKGRIYRDRIEMQKDSIWQWAAFGHWVQPATDPAALANSTEVIVNVRNPRSRWKNETYNNTIYYEGGNRWVQRNDAGPASPLRLTEISRTEEYIELSGFKIFGTGRLFSNKLLMKKGDRWEWCSTGRWLE